jgi:monooxygenase
VISRPSQDSIGNWLRRVLPAGAAYGITRWKNVLMGMLFFRLSKRRPEGIKQYIVKAVREALGPDYDVDKHFTPNYKPWDQRVCMVTDGDLFKAIKDGRASMVTDHIDTFTENGIKLKSGQELEADMIVTATGLKLQVFGGMELVVDGKTVQMGKSLNYKGMMFSDVPNLASVVGYTNASWTLKADLTSQYVCRLLNHMQQQGLRQCTPRRNDPSVTEEPWVDFTSGYVQRSLAEFPKPWRLYQNYALDIVTLRMGKIEDGVMEFANPIKKG